MEYRTLGGTGLRVSELALGTMQFGWTADEETSFALMDAFAEVGGTLIDTSDIYSRWAAGNPGGVSEEIIGRWMKARGNRHEIVLATKVRGRMWDGPNGEGLSRAHILRAVEDSLRRLQTDRIDLYQAHFYDDETPIQETMGALDSLVRAGQVRFVGCSNYSAWQLEEAIQVSEQQGLVSYVSLQPHYSLVYREEFEADLADVVLAYGLGVFPYSPLQGGFLTGKYRADAELPDSVRAEGIQKRYFSERNFRVLARVEEVARNHGWTIAQVALAWLLAHPLVTAPIVGANSVEQLQELLGAAGLRLGREEVDGLNRVSEWREEG